MSIVTKTGDRGQTGLFGGARVSKADDRMQACGSVDELNAMMGAAVAFPELPPEIQSVLVRMQHLLFVLGADLATPYPGTRPDGTKVPAPNDPRRIEEHHTAIVDAWVKELEEQLPSLQWFILPSGSPAGAHLHLARTVCRRAERWTVALSGHEEVNPQAIVFLNRLSDCLFLLARAANLAAGCEETRVEYE